MELHQLVNTLGQDLQRRYGQKVHKLTLHGNFTCPNRDGTLGRGGCTFCNVASFAQEEQAGVSVGLQLAERKREADRARLYLAYFQAYTSTYGEVEQLRSLYEQALESSHMVGLCVGTRPDCVPDAVLELLAGYRREGAEIWLELGLQSASDRTLKRINRGHGFVAYRDAVGRARALGLKVCTHLIVGLPGEDKADNLDTLQKVVAEGVDGIKLHPLHIVTGSKLAQAYQAGRQPALEFEDYVDTAVAMIQRTPPEVVYHRVSASARRPTLIAPQWCENRWLAMVEIGKRLDAGGPQGSALGRPFIWQPPGQAA